MTAETGRFSSNEDTSLLPLGKRGFFISMESIDGLGKTTQIRLLGKALEDAGHRVFYTKEPGDEFIGSNVGAGIRKMLFKYPSTKNMRSGVADMLFLADHIQTAGDVREAVNEGKVVLCDRYADSQFAYAASYGKQCPQWALDVYADQFGIVPDLTILLRARGLKTHTDWVVKGKVEFEDISWALKRAKARKGHEEGKQDGKAWNDAEQQRRIQDAYLHYLGQQERTFIVDIWENTDIGSIHETILVETLRRMAEQTVSKQSIPYELLEYVRVERKVM